MFRFKRLIYKQFLSVGFCRNGPGTPNCPHFSREIVVCRRLNANTCTARLTARRSGHHFPVAVFIVAITSSRLNFAGFWRSGNSLKVAMYSPTYVCAGTNRKA